MCVNILWRVSISKAFYRVAVELDEVAQLLVFTLGMLYLYLGVLMPVFRVTCVVYVLINCFSTASQLFLSCAMDIDTTN